jgi:hypothetical protein
LFDGRGGGRRVCVEEEEEGEVGKRGRVSEKREGGKGEVGK